MPAHPTSYLVLATQRSGSTLLVESLRATGSAGEPQEFFQYLPTTGMAPQPREGFAGADDESILRLLDPLEPGTPDTATPVAWREHIRSSGRTPNGIWGGKLMWNQTPLLGQRASQLPDRSGETLKAAGRGVPSGVCLAGRADPGMARPARPRARLARDLSRGCDRLRRAQSARPGEELARLVRRGRHHADRHLLPGVVAQPDFDRRRDSHRTGAGSQAGSPADAGTTGQPGAGGVGSPLSRRGPGAGPTHLNAARRQPRRR